MQFSEQIIAIIDDLCRRFGIVIDWSNELYAEITIPGLDPNNWREHRAVAGLRPKELPEFSTEGASLIDIMELG